eukprot:5829680-Pleurochrysis_carterae.AAC.1
MNGIAIGSGCETNMYHFNVRPKDDLICSFHWLLLVNVLIRRIYVIQRKRRIVLLLYQQRRQSFKRSLALARWLCLAVCAIRVRQ